MPTSLTVTVDSATATARAEAQWDVTCTRNTLITAELRVCAPHRFQNPIKVAYGRAFKGSSTATGSVNVDNPKETAVLTISEAGIPFARFRACAKRPNGTNSCYPRITGPNDFPPAALCV